MLEKRKQKIVVGVDESGRGPLAGPVIACAITVQQFSFFSNRAVGSMSQLGNSQFSNNSLKDGKKLSPQKREEIFKILKRHPGIEWGIGRVSEKVIDKINIFQATKLAMKRAVKNLTKKLKNREAEKQRIDFLLLDGNFKINLPIPQNSIIRGDEKIFLIKLSSIVAKVTRDRAMLRYHKKYPQYRFDKHKGYGTKLHLEMLKKYGPCKIHRKTFGPVREIPN